MTAEVSLADAMAQIRAIPGLSAADADALCSVLVSLRLLRGIAPCSCCQGTRLMPFNSNAPGAPCPLCA